MDCKEPRCIEIYKEEMQDVNSDDDEDFKFFHCSVKGCHDISMGKTSFRCEECLEWVCQGHGKDYEDDVYCPDCYKMLKSN